MTRASSSAEESRILKAWSLAGQKASTGGMLRSATISCAARAVSATLSGGGLRGLLIPLASGERIRLSQAFRGGSPGALRAEAAQFMSDEGAVFALHVWCVDERCNDAFAAFADLLVERLGEGALSDQLSDCYHEFIRLVGERGGPVSGVVGLLGELLVLRDAVAADAAAIGYWGGPRGERHDFRRAAVAVEVKTTRRAESKTRRIHVSDWDQLEIPQDGRLYLHAVRVEQCVGGELSVPRLISELRGVLGGHAGAFEQILGEVEPSLLTVTDEFSLHSRATFHVLPEFPRLLRSDLKDATRLKGVSAVGYDLDLEQALEFEIPWPQAISDLVGRK